MLSIEDVMPGGEWYDRIVSWKKTSAKYGSTEVIDAIPIANMGQRTTGLISIRSASALRQRDEGR
jgi:hypothetical protein